MTEADRALLRRRAIAVGLVLSLAVNVFFVSLALTDWLRGKPVGPRALRIELRWLERDLPREGLKRIEAALAKLQPDVDARLARLRAMRGEVNALAAAPNPDRAAIDAKIAMIKSESAAIQLEVEKTTFDTLLALPPQLRSGLAKK